MSRLTMRTFLLATLSLTTWMTSGQAGDWPQILGPNRNGSAVQDSLADQWPQAGPPSLWNRDVGSGFSGVAVVGDRGIVFHRVEDVERVEAFDVATGKAVWKADFPTSYRPAFVDDNGPRAAPVIHDGKVYVFGAMGQLSCVDFAKGTKVWSRNTFKEYYSGRSRGEPAEGYFGLGSSPIIEGNLVIVNVGGEEKEAGIVAFNAASGEPVWNAGAERASYSSPVAVTVGKTRHLIVETRLNTLSLDPKNGTIRWTLPFGKRGPTVNGACPTVIDGHLFLTASYGIGATFAKIHEDSAETLWTSDDVCSSQYTTCVEDGGVLYGVHGRQDVGGAALRCFDPKTQDVLWSKENFGYATLIKADGKLLIVTTDGQLVLAALDKTRYRELARAEVLSGTARALPALSNGRVYLRNERTLKCVDIGK
ncbi:MAG: PQQ-like beta-propeller repeat protein [Planctomycetaceae bacterium]|nr:PQQ-like beta-propeller repeat protein [Planctomycetaceae bacterium]